MLSLIIFIIFACLFAFSLITNISEKRRLKKVEEWRRSLPKYETKINWFAESEYADKFLKAYRNELEENEDYNLSAKELKEYYDEEKVYKYEPLKLPMKIEDLDVYSYIDEDDWIRIGRLKKNADLDGELTLYLYPNTYKYVTEDNIEKETEDSYFGVEVKRVTHDLKK